MQALQQPGMIDLSSGFPFESGLEDLPRIARRALDRNDLVTYVGTFSKTLMPGIRVGYLVVTGKHYQPLMERKLLSDLHEKSG